MKSRKSNKAKHISNGCKNHGSCERCRNSRTHSNRRREPITGPLVDALLDIERSYTFEERRHAGHVIRTLAERDR